MAVYSPSGSGNVHYDQILTNISLAWPREVNYIGEQLFPAVPVKKQSDKYYVFGKEAWLPEDGDYRAPGTEANEIPGIGISLDTYYAQEHALQIAVTDEERENADNPMNPDRDGTELVTGKILLGRELMIRNMVTNSANYASGFSVTLSGTAQWSDTVNSNPFADVRAGIRKVHQRVFLEPNTIIIPYLVMSYLEDNAKIMDRIKYTDRAILTPEIIGAVLGISGMKVLVPGVAYGTGSANNVTATYLWGDDVIMAYVPPRPGLKVPAFGYEFCWTFGGQQQIVDRWREDKRASDLIRVRRRYDLKAVGTEQNTSSADFGKWITGYLIKDTLAGV